MRALLTLIMLVTFQESWAYEIRVQQLELKENMDSSYVLKTLPFLKVSLDCQSFVQGLTLGEHPGLNFILMEPSECEDLLNRIKNSLASEEEHCLDLDEVIHSDYSCAD